MHHLWPLSSWFFVPHYLLLPSNSKKLGHDSLTEFRILSENQNSQRYVPGWSSRWTTARIEDRASWCFHSASPRRQRSQVSVRRYQGINHWWCLQTTVHPVDKYKHEIVTVSTVQVPCFSSLNPLPLGWQVFFFSCATHLELSTT